MKDYFKDVEFIKMITKFNFSDRYDQKIKYIVIHDTGNYDKGADALAHGKYFCRKKLNSSAHYFVDERRIVQVVEDENSAWHCGDGRNRFGINNYNSISIELCVNNLDMYYKTLENSVKLTVYLAQKYNIPSINVLRHYDASRKICPRSMRSNNWLDWKKFKEKIEKFPHN